MTTEQCAEQLRREASLAYRMVLVMAAGLTEDGRYSDSGRFAAAMDTCDGVIAAEGDWSAQQWCDVARHLAMLVAGELAVRMGTDRAIEYMGQQIGVVLDPAAFLAALEESL